MTTITENLKVKTQSGSTYVISQENGRYFFSRSSDHEIYGYDGEGTEEMKDIEFDPELSEGISVGFSMHFVLMSDGNEPGVDIYSTKVVEIEKIA